MPAVFVHGVPETAELWDPLRLELEREDVVALQMPGFGCPRPEGFDATKEQYVAWLADTLEALGAGGPIDLVGHDWGGALTTRLVTTRPELVRSWVTDAAAIATAGFEWHDFAKIWQTPGDGEAFFEANLAASPEERAGAFEAMGVPREEAIRLGSWTDETMAECILALYRSAVDVGTEWSADLGPVDPPGLVLSMGDDPFMPGELNAEVAERAGARLEAVDGLGHWWMLQDPAGSARLLEAFWATSA